MRINLYSESPDAGPGGAEQFIAVLAEALSASHEVSIVHHKPPEGETNWQQYSGSDLSRVKFRHVARETDQSSLCRNPWTRYRAAKSWRRELSADCDCFIALLHNRAPFCRAKKGVMIVLFPTYQPLLELKTPIPPKRLKSKKVKRKTKAERNWFSSPVLRRLYLKWEWRQRMKSYPIKLAISDFSREWTKGRWGIHTGLLFPPVVISPRKDSKKENQILSVGRFATTGHTKKQIQLLNAFREIQNELSAWSYSSVGGLNETEADGIYFERSAQFRDANRIEIEANLPRARIEDLYARSKIFWHAAGLGDDHAASPEMAEHFGLSTVEAMAQGCVPIVINKGGQSEIVQHGVNGFLWDSLDQLQNHTRRLAADAALWEKMSEAARKRAGDFSKESCVLRLLAASGLKQN